MTIKELIELKEILASDSISTTRLTVNDNFKKLRKGLISVIDSLQINEGPNINVESVEADDIVANSFSTPLPRDGVYNFRVNSNGEITAKSIFTNTWMETPRLRLDPDPTTIAFQAGEIRWSGTDFLGYDGTNWISLTAGAAIPITTGPLVVNQLYEIVSYGSGDDFTNVGASSNALGVTFVATGTTPAVWTNGSVLASSNGEANTASNAGTGVGIFKTKAGVNLEFKSLVSGTGVYFDITNPDQITINSTASSGVSGYSGTGSSGYSGYSGVSGFSGLTGSNGASGLSGFSGQGVSGFSGISGQSGQSGESTSGFSGYSGISGYSGSTGASGFSGESGISGFSGMGGATGESGVSGFSGLGESGFSGFSGASGAGSSTLGPAEDGSYLDGLWTDLTPSTPIGTFADRVNEILLALAPPPAPSLSTWTQTTLSLSVTGKLSFDTSNPIAGYNNADTAVPPVLVDGTFSVSGNRLGITQKVGGSDLSGVLNNHVTTGPGTPTPAYVAKSFGEADKGYLKMYINGAEYVPARVNLSSTTSAIDTTSAGANTGISVSASSPSLFPTGTPLPSFQNRTGTWKIKKTNLSAGYNYVQIIHEVTPSNLKVLTIFEVVCDDNSTPTQYTGEVLYNPLMTGSKKLSGIDYHTGGTLAYDLVVNNAYLNTYSSSASAISHTSSTNGYGALISCAAQALPPNGGSETAPVNLIAKSVSFLTGKRIINEDVSLTTTVLRTVQGTTTSPGDTIGTFLLDNVTSTSTLATLEAFDDEQYRLTTASNYDLIADVAANAWDSTQSIIDGSVGHTDGLQIIDGKLISPGNNVSYPVDYTTANIQFGSTFNNGGVGGSARIYTQSPTIERTYIRYFQKVSPTTANFVMTISGSGGTFVPLTTPLTGNNIHVEIKGPSQTGWMDAYADFATGQFSDGDGARNATAGAGRAFGAAWGLTIGTKNTANTGGYMLVRITVAPGFTGSLTSINWAFA